MPHTSAATLPQPSAVPADRFTPRPRVHDLRPKLRINSQSLFEGTDELEIEHGDALYRLRITSLGKLILTK